MRPLPLALLAAALALPACQPAPPTTVVASATPPPPRSISVTGTAEIATAPDELTVVTGVESFALEPQAAKEANDRTMTALLATARAFAPDAKDVRTEGFSLQPHYDNDTRRTNGYDARKTLIVVVHDSEKAESLLAELFKGGANRLDGVSYGSTKILEQRKEARALAVAAARDKATAMASALGQKLGRPLKIDEDPEAGRYRALAGNELSNMAVQSDARSAPGEAMATGKIRIATSVAVTFELAD